MSDTTEKRASLSTAFGLALVLGLFVSVINAAPTVILNDASVAPAEIATDHDQSVIATTVQNSEGDESPCEYSTSNEMESTPPQQELPTVENGGDAQSGGYAQNAGKAEEGGELPEMNAHAEALSLETCGFFDKVGCAMSCLFDGHTRYKCLLNICLCD